MDPADRLVWEPGDAAQCDLWFQPRRIPTRKTEDLLLGSWELIKQLGRVPAPAGRDNEPGIGRGQRRAEGVTSFMGTLATKLVLLPPNDPQSKGIVERRNV